MSIASFFGNKINSPPPNGKIVYANENKEVNIVKLLANNVAASSDDMVLGNVDGVAEWRLLEAGGDTIVPTLAEVMTQAGVAGSDLNMSTFNITSPGTLNLIAANGIGFDTASDSGAIGDVLVSQGNAPPVWSTIALSDLPLTGDLNMAGNGLVDCASITNDAQFPLNIIAPSLSIIGKTTFNDVPACADAPVSDIDIANKAYVDSTLAAANGVTTDTANSFTAVNTFFAGANIAIPTLAYAATTADPAAYVKFGTTTPGLSIQNNVWSYTGNADATWTLPDPQSCAGSSVYIINGGTAGTLTVNGTIQNLVDGQNVNAYSGFHMHYTGCVHLVSFNAVTAYRWGLTMHSANVDFGWN